MSQLVERYRSFLRPGRKVSDMFLLACIITFLLILLGSLLSGIVLNLVGMPGAIDESVMDQIVNGEITVEEAMGAPAYLAWASSYLQFFGIWIVFFLAMLIPPANRKMLKKFLLVNNKRSLAWVGIGALVGFGINTMCVLGSILLGDLALHFERFEIGPLLLLLFAVFIQSGAEEIASRLFLYQKLARRYRSPVVAIVVSAVFFALAHAFNPGITPLAVAQLLVIGVLLAVLVCYYDALGACIALHTLWNYTQNIIFGLPNSGAVSLYSIFKVDAAANGFFFDPVFGVEGSIGSVLLLTLVCVGLIVNAKKGNLQPYDLWADEESVRQVPARMQHAQMQ